MDRKLKRLRLLHMIETGYCNGIPCDPLVCPLHGRCVPNMIEKAELELAGMEMEVALEQED